VSLEAGDLTRDAFLGGRVHLLQPRTGYRAGVDPVLLAAAVEARSGQSCLDLGCGVGAASLCLHARVPGLDLWGVELQPAYAALARRNAAEAGAAMEVVEADIADLPPAVRARQFDHVIANPPYFRTAARNASPDDGREAARAGAAMADWVEAAARRARPGGRVVMIQRIERLPELLAGFAGRLGSVEALPVASRAGRAPGLVLLRARKGGRADFVLHAPLVMHAGAAHAADGDDYLPEISAILRDGAALDWPVRSPMRKNPPS
jgi:tRNA1(Val) A37 N6-methylase TrmN6